MADLAIGISKAAVEALVNKVNTAMKEEAELWQIVQQDTVFMRDEFEMMQSFLNTADGERIKNSVVKTWVRQVRDLSYDAEDFIDSVLLLDTKRSFWTLWLRVLASCSCNQGEPSPLDQAVAEVKLLKARVEEVRNRNMRYSLVNDPGDMSAVTQKKPTVCATSAVDILVEAWRTAKKQGGLVDLTMLITENSNALRVISLWETGGHLGMTSIIKEAYEKPEICQKFRARAWLNLAHPFNPHEFIRRLAHQFYRNSWKEHGEEIHGVDVLTGLEAAQGTDLVKEFVRQLSQHRYLVVIEGLSSMAEWHAVRTYLPDSKNGSRIVVSTQHLEIARLCPGQYHQVLELRKLPDNHSVCAFFHQDFKRIKEGRMDGCSSSLESANVHLVGRNSDEDKLLNLLSRAGSQTAHVISVCGFPGLGKSALVRSIFQHHRGNQEGTSPFDKCFWVDVSYPFNFSEFCRRMHSFMLLQTQTEYVYMPKQSEPDEKIIQDCIIFMQSFRCLLIIDGLRSKEEWMLISSLIRLPSISHILVVTAEKDIAKYCAQQDDAVFEVKALPFEAALQLFKQDFRGTGTFRDAHMLKEAKYILAKCGGIPKVIVALATYLGTQQEDIGQLKLKLNLLKANFMQELETNPEFVGLRDLFAWMHFRYCELPQCLKPCILYWPVFSQVKIIRRSRFVRRWIAEGYSKCTNSKTMEEHTVELFNMLAKERAIVPELHDNSFFNEYIKLRLMEERVLFFPPVVTLLDENHSMTAEWQAQHLTIASSWKREDEFSFTEWDLSHLQSLTVHGQWSRFFIPCRMRSLRVLDLEGTHHVGDDELKRFLELLARLRFLSLRRHKEITRLPDSLSTLRHLQTLDIRGTSAMYVDLQKLQKLQYIRAGISKPFKYDDDVSAAEDQLTPSSISSRTLVSFLPKFLRCGPSVPCNGIKVPTGIHHLKALHTLGAINVNTANGNAILDEISLLKQLKKLDVSGINQKNSKKLCHAIINQKNLESLSLQLERENHVVQWDHISPPSSVRSLKLYGHVEKLSDLRIRNLKNLNKLSLEMTRLLTPKDVHLLGSLSSLHTLRLHVNKGQNGDLKIQNNLFPNLHEFEIVCRSRLHLKFDEGAIAKLEKLKVHCCSESDMNFSGVVHLVSLKEVCLKGIISQERHEALQQQCDDHSNEVSLKLN